MWQLAHAPGLLDAVDVRSLTNPRERVGLLLAWRASGRPDGLRLVRDFLADPDEDVRFLAAKWVADQKLLDYRPTVAEALKDRRLNVRLFFAYSAALARLDGRDVNEAQMANYFFDRLADAQAPTPVRVLALQMIPPAYARLTPDLLDGLLAHGEPALQREAARALGELPSPRRFPVLRTAAHDRRLDDNVRAEAVLGLAGHAQDFLDDLLGFAHGDSAVLRDEALRALPATRLDASQRAGLEAVAHAHPDDAALVARALGKPFVKDRPPPTDLDGWLKRLDGPADPAAGRRVFFHPKLAACYRCHRAEGRGQEVGPDLSTVGRSGRRQIVESILQPSALVAPDYQAWDLEMAGGTVRTGMLVKTVLDEYTYLDAKGDQFKVNTRDVAETRPSAKSIMPDGLPDLLTDQELRDLVAYLCSLR